MNSFPDRAKSDSPQCDNLPQRKILGIGLSRTGTTSLHLAMGMLGYRSIHCPRLDRLGEILEHYQAAVDTPIACSFRELDLCYPDSLFILTIRDIRSADPVPPKKFQLSIPDQFQDAVMVMLAKRPELRYQTPTEAARALERNSS